MEPLVNLQNTSSATLSLLFRRTGLPCAAIDREAASKISTTRKPVIPSEMGVAPVRMQAMK